MPFTTVTFNESLDPAAAFENIAATPDDHVTVSGDDIQVPAFNQIVGYGGAVDLTVAAQLRLRSPSLITNGYEIYIQPFASGLTFGAQAEFMYQPHSPIPLVRLEALQAQVLSNPAAAAQHYVIVQLADGPLAPVRGDIRTIRATAAIAIVVTGWTNGALTFPVSLAAGRYQLVGARVQSTNGVAFRFRVQGSWHRPGGPCVNAQTDNPIDPMRMGNYGVWAEFEHTTPPTLDVIGVTDTAQVVYLDLIRTR